MIRQSTNTLSLNLNETRTSFSTTSKLTIPDPRISRINDFLLFCFVYLNRQYLVNLMYSPKLFRRFHWYQSNCMISEQLFQSRGGVIKPISSVPLFSEFFSIIKLHVSYQTSRLYLAGVSRLSCGDICQTWMWFKECGRCFHKIENFVRGEINERSFSNPLPRGEGAKARFVHFSVKGHFYLQKYRLISP